MKLHEALETFLHSDAPKERIQECAKTVYEFLMLRASTRQGQLKADGLSVDPAELANQAIVKLYEVRTDRSFESESAAEAYLTMTVKNLVKDRFRARKKSHVSLPTYDDGAEKEFTDSLFESETNALDLLEHRDEAANSIFVGEGDIVHAVTNYIREKILPTFHGKASTTGMVALAEMIEIADDSSTFADIIARECESSGDSETRVSNRIHKNHSRTRARLEDWVRGEDCPLIPLDRRILDAYIERHLRSRARKS